MSAVDSQPGLTRAVVVPRRLAGIEPRAMAVIGGYALLVGALAIVLFYPNGMLPIVLAGGATLLLSFDRKLGPLPAALLVMLALPVGRGSEVGLPRILGDVPLRAHDVVSAVGVILALPTVVRRLRRPTSISWPDVIPVAVFTAVGLLALAIGFVGDQAARDIVRDARWWAFYGVGLLALLAGTRRPAIIRAVIWGLTIYSAILLIALLMPMFHGGLKYGAYAYDPRLRLHYGQAVMLLVAVAIVVDRFARRPTISLAFLLALLAAAIGVTLTRTLLAGVLGVGVLAAVWAAVVVARGGWVTRPRALGLRAVPAVLAIAFGIGAGFAIYQFGTGIWTPDWAYSDDGGSGVSGRPTSSRPVLPSLGRVFDDTANAGFDAQAGGRLASYAEAFVDTSASPIIGHGMGQQASVSWAWGGFRARNAGSQPGVDNAFLTVGIKAGAVGIAAFAAMVLWPLRQVMRPSFRRMRPWFIPAWLALLGLMMIQSFAVSGYAPLAVAVVLVLPGLGPIRARRAD